MELHLDRIHFGLAQPGSVLRFAIRPGPGYSVRAVLDCDLKTVASWEFIELEGGRIAEETLVPPGTYTLTVDVAYLSAAPVPVAMEFSLTPPGQPPQPFRFLTLTGVRPDIGRALVVAIV